MRYRFIKKHAQSYPVRLLCRVMKVSKSAFYAWKARPAQLITAQELHLYRRTKKLFGLNRTDGISLEFEPWRFNLRCSNTEPVVRLNVESKGDLNLMQGKTEGILSILRA